MPVSRQQYRNDQAVINREKIELAKTLEGKYVVIDGIQRKVTGFNSITGDAEIRIGVRTTPYDPRNLRVVEKE